MTSQSDDSQNVGPFFVDNPHAPDVFADSVTGIFNFNGVVRLTFETLRVSHVSSPGPVNRVVIGRLVIPAHAAKHLGEFLMAHFNQQEKASQAISDAPKTIN